MKKVKLMLLSLSILAVVGGALAFTAKGSNKFCTAVINPANPYCNKACPNFTERLLANAGDFICTTTTTGVLLRPCKDINNVTLPCVAASAQYFPEQP